MEKPFIILLLSFFILSCSKESAKQIKENKPFVPHEKSYSASECTVQREEKNIILLCNGKKTIYEGLIVDEMSISTDFIKGENNEFYLMYELNASATKMKEKYNFIYSDRGIFLVYKEVLKFGKGGLMGNRIYFEPIDMKGKSFENIQSLGDQLEEIFSQNNAAINYFDTNNKIFAKNTLNETNEDIFINYPEISQNKIAITDAESANNLAFLLEQKDANKESELLLQHIIAQYPERVVAYLNLADVEWKINSQDEAKKHYNFYLSLMKKQNKSVNKIPQRVYDRIK
ncbi:tetratricopeptide repeat protein [Chryseobacterium sp. MYb264]|uniref:tetratricopeptide repeat protein n=1 Tax=Chryseobacterium sp. MYb264 TaxID=2745153 RepID=UPI002E0DE071|nr:tetratricopeptide repeat protein [Chryseobacterium sp. MYb264]